MKRTAFIALALGLLFTLFSSAAYADPEYVDDIIKEDHKVRNKWDLEGEFVAYPGYNWNGMAEGATWTYKIHIKEAMDGRVSKGTIHFYTVVNGTEINVVGHVKETKQDYGYWGSDIPNLAAVGTAEYNGQTYFFMFLYAQRATWFAISTTPYDSYWSVESVWGSGLRDYQLHSLNTDDFLVDYKEIRTD